MPRDVPATRDEIVGHGFEGLKGCRDGVHVWFLVSRRPAAQPARRHPTSKASNGVRQITVIISSIDKASTGIAHVCTAYALGLPGVGDKRRAVRHSALLEVAPLKRNEVDPFADEALPELAPVRPGERSRLAPNRGVPAHKSTFRRVRRRRTLRRPAVPQRLRQPDLSHPVRRVGAGIAPAAIRRTGGPARTI